MCQARENVLKSWKHLKVELLTFGHRPSFKGVRFVVGEVAGAHDSPAAEPTFENIKSRNRVGLFGKTDDALAGTLAEEVGLDGDIVLGARLFGRHGK